MYIKVINARNLMIAKCNTAKKLEYEYIYYAILSFNVNITSMLHSMCHRPAWKYHKDTPFDIRLYYITVATR